MPPLFTDTEDDILLEEVANHPSLWQLSHTQYKDQRMKDNIWTLISDKVGKPTDQCKKRWRNVKDTYDKKKNKKTGSASTPTKKGRKWILEEKLSFLRNAEEHRGSFTNLNNEQENETIDCPQSCDDQISMESSTSTPTETLPSQSSTTAPKPSPCPQYWTTTLRGKRTNTRVKIGENLEQRATDRNAMMKALLAEDAEDDIDLFFKSMAKSVKKLTPALERRAKLETLNLITKLETENWHPSSCNSCESNSYCSGTPNILSPTILSPSSEVDSSQNGSILVITQSPETFHQYESL